MPARVGDCTSRRVFVANGDVLQYTASGLMVRRKSDNWTAFTDGYVTWIDGPRGLTSRLNSERLPWEHDAVADASARTSPAAGRVGPPSAYPDPSLTPGETDPRVTQADVHETICTASYTSLAQPSAQYTDRLKVRQIGRYGYADTDPASYAEDNFVPIELGGDPDAPSNLWPQPYAPAPGANEKNRVEMYLHDQVCSGAMSLAQAQQAILNDWVAVYEQLP